MNTKKTTTKIHINSWAKEQKREKTLINLMHMKGKIHFLQKRRQHIPKWRMYGFFLLEKTWLTQSMYYNIVCIPFRFALITVHNGKTSFDWTENFVYKYNYEEKISFDQQRTSILIVTKIKAIAKKRTLITKSQVISFNWFFDSLHSDLDTFFLDW